MKNILVPTDFSPESHNAFEVALQLAQRTGGSVTLLHALDELGSEPNSPNFSAYGGPVNSSEIPNSEGIVDGLFAIKVLEVTKQRMQALIAEAAQRAPGVPVQDVAGPADVDEAILRTVAERNIDLVVMGAQHHDTLEHFFQGSETEHMVRLAPCPVLAVKHPHPQFEVRRVVFPSDFSTEADGVVPALKRVLAVFPEATLHLLHVATDSAQVEARTQMVSFAERHQLHRARLTIFDADSTSTGIEEFAQEVHADLIVMPTHARSGFSRLFHSSVAEKVATHAFPPVLTLHFPASAR